MNGNSVIPELGGIVLCGGGSTRMGRPKALLPLGDSTFLERICSIVTEVATKTIVVTGDKNLDLSIANCPLLSDQFPNRGPLEGVRVGLESLQKEFEYAFVTGCDVPLLKPALIRKLFDAAQGHEAVVPVDQEKTYGLLAIYRTDLAQRLAQTLDRGELRVTDFVSTLNAVKIATTQFYNVDPDLDSFANINDQNQLSSLAQRLQASNDPGGQ